MPLNAGSYVSMVLGSFLIIVGIYANIKISSLEKDLAVSQSDARDFELSFKSLINDFESQSESIEKNKADKENAEKRLKEFLSTPVRERVVTNTITIYKDINTTREDRTCEDYKKIESNTYDLDWNK